MSSLSATREVELDSVAAGTFETKHGSRTTRSAPGTYFRLPPERHWKSGTHFHADDLRVSAANSSKHDDGTLLFCWEARAREGIAVALSADAKFKGTEIILGASGNTQTVLQHKKKIRVSAPGRVCREDVWVSYWIAACNSKIYAGVGSAPGEQCVAILDLNRSREAASKVVVVDQSAKEEEKNSSDAHSVETDAAVGVPSDAEGDKAPSFRYVGLRNAGTADRHAPTHMRVRNLQLTTVSTELSQQLNKFDVDALDMIVLGENELDTLSATDRETVTLLCQYRDACAKARARAVKFGVPYQAPDLAATLPWSQARRLRANPVAASGFPTGMDLQTAEEKARQEQRKARFGAGNKNDEEEVKDEAQANNTDVAVLLVEQAWDKVDLVGMHRVDPPTSLWMDPPADAQEEKDEFRMELQEPGFAAEKIHIVSIDWAAFKQIRTPDILSHFSAYGPTYVEWLGDLSCNVLFEDKFSAARALENMSQQLPSPPPEGAAEGQPDLGRMGWRLGKTPLLKKSNDRYGKRGTKARLLMRVATSLDILHERPNKWPKPPAGFTTQQVLGPESDLPLQKSKKAKKKHKKNDDASGNDDTISSKDRGLATAESLMSGGLSSARAGFSMEEMEAERAKKKAKVSES